MCVKEIHIYQCEKLFARNRIRVVVGYWLDKCAPGVWVWVGGMELFPSSFPQLFSSRDWPLAKQTYILTWGSHSPVTFADHRKEPSLNWYEVIMGMGISRLHCWGWTDLCRLIISVVLSSDADALCC